MYHAFALLQPGNELTLAAVAAKLRAKFPHFNLEQADNTITLSHDNWDYQLALQSGPDVLRESENLAGRIAGLEEDSPLRMCDHSLEVWSDTPDPFMEYFDLHFQILDVLRTFEGVILVDPHEPAIL